MNHLDVTEPHQSSIGDDRNSRVLECADNRVEIAISIPDDMCLTYL